MNIPDLQLDGLFKIQQKIGGGSFGQIYLGTSTSTNEEVAIKLESTSTQHPQLQYESRIYRILKGCQGVPNLLYFCSESEYNVLIIDLLGPSLEDLYNYSKRKFTLKTVLILVDQFITRVELMHSKHLLHRDIKPDNFLIGRGKKSTQVYIIDFGLAKKFEDSKTLQHIVYREGKSLTGTARYASLNTHLGIEQSRRDDIEGIGYVMLYFLKGGLPWQGLRACNKKDKYQRIMEKKMNITVDSMCRGVPEEFAVLINYARALRFEEKPDYTYLKRIFKDLMTKENLQCDYLYDWVIINQVKTT